MTEKTWGPIPRYAMLDIWCALFGADHPEEFERFADQWGYAETWAWLCSGVREGRRTAASIQ